MTDSVGLMAALVAHARKAGADAADAILVAGTSLNVHRRGGQTEQLERSESRDIGLRVFLGRRSATVSASSVDPSAFARLAEQAVAMARVVPEDPYGGLAEDARIEPDPGLDLEDPSEPAAGALLARADAAEAAALEVAGVTNTEGGSASYSRTEAVLVTSAGFQGRYVRTGHSTSTSVLAGTGTGMERDYEYTSAVHLEDLEDPVAVGRRAAERAVARLNPVRARTAVLPVVFDPRESSSLLGHLLGAINGSGVARGTSFLKDKMGQRLFAPGITIRDDPRRRRGPRSRPFDAEGIPTAARALVEDGVLASWLLDSRSARQLGLKSTGHAARATGGQPGPNPSNVWLEPGRLNPAALMADIKEGLYVTELIGMGVNGLTGDYSRGASGFMIRDGQLAEAVSEITIAGHLLEMFATLTPGDDLQFRRGTDAPTIRVEKLTLAGA